MWFYVQGWTWRSTRTPAIFQPSAVQTISTVALSCVTLLSSVVVAACSTIATSSDRNLTDSTVACHTWNP